MPPAGAFGFYLAGRFAAAAADAPAAAGMLAEALRREPDEAEVLRLAFGAAVMDGQASAVRLARRLPDDQLAAMLVAGADAQAGRWDRAEARLRALPRQGAAQVLQPLLVAWAQVGRGRTDAALGTLRPWTEAGPLRGIAALHAAMILDLAGRTGEAARFARLALQQTPESNLRLVAAVAGILSRAGHDAEGAALFDAVIDGGGDVALAATPAARRAALSGRAVAGPVEGMAEAQVALGGSLRARGASDVSLLLARLALRLRPGFAPALLLAAESMTDGQHPENAVAVLDAVPAANDGLGALAALRRAVLLDRVGRTGDAVAALRALSERYPEAVQPPARLGDILRARGRYAEAAVAYDEALSRGAARPRASGGGAGNAAADRANEALGDWTLFYARGIALERSGDWPRAERDFQRALVLSPEQPYVLNYLAYTWAERGERLPDAQSMLERAAELQPEDGNIADSLGWVLFRLGDHAGAVRMLERASELESRSSVVNDHLGDAYWATGRHNEARFQWSRALDLDPEPAEVARLQAKLRDGVRAAAR